MLLMGSKISFEGGTTKPFMLPCAVTDYLTRDLIGPLCLVSSHSASQWLRSLCGLSGIGCGFCAFGGDCTQLAGSFGGVDRQAPWDESSLK
jgi:hypothetical protein